ncbi:MAG: acetyl-CoA synthetase [Thermoprotei archaeon]|nr:MAG: acetyl-CoA synthetase [Thermoprotei archaeon]RLF17815.1 MAG: acetyl-CoA synthetase [Thermoprotei archaeon]
MSLEDGKRRLAFLFYPRSVAVVGASKNTKKMGYHALKSLIEGGFKGPIYPINPGYSSIFGLKAYSSLKDVPGEIDLAIIVVPAKVALEVLEECREAGVKGAVLITAGLREAELEEGPRLQEELRRIAEKSKVKVIGPNTFGMVNLHADLNAGFTPSFSRIKKGVVSLVSQSGGVCHLLMPYILEQGIGMSKIVGLGNRLNVDFADMLEYLAHDEDTRSIALYVEGIDEPRKLMETARRVARVKPIVAFKTGRSRKADAASKSHTGSLAGNYELYKAAFKQSGIVVADGSLELISKADALAHQPPAKGRRVAVISLVAGLGIIAADTCEAKGLELTEFTEETVSKIKKLLPPFTIRTNPVDLGFVANDPEKCGEAIRLVFDDPNVDAVVVNYIFSWSEDFLLLPIEAIISSHRETGKPVTMCLRYPHGVWDVEKESLRKASIPIFPTPELAVEALKALVEYGEYLSRANVPF